MQIGISVGFQQRNEDLLAVSAVVGFKVQVILWLSSWIEILALRRWLLQDQGAGLVLFHVGADKVNTRLHD